jgi:hypothetical protein
MKTIMLGLVFACVAVAVHAAVAVQNDGTYIGEAAVIDCSAGINCAFDGQKVTASISGGAVSATTLTASSTSNLVGNITTAGTFISSNATTLGWSIISSANTFGTSMCTNACVFCINSDVTVADIIDCSTATADKCVCAGGK